MSRRHSFSGSVTPRTAFERKADAALLHCPTTPVRKQRKVLAARQPATPRDRNVLPPVDTGPGPDPLRLGDERPEDTTPEADFSLPYGVITPLDRSVITPLDRSGKTPVDQGGKTKPVPTRPGPRPLRDGRLAALMAHLSQAALDDFLKTGAVPVTVRVRTPADLPKVRRALKTRLRDRHGNRCSSEIKQVGSRRFHVSLRPTSITNLCEMPEVERVEMAKPLTPSDRSVIEPLTGIDPSDRVLGLTGKGVIIGVVDTGLDETHPMVAPGPAAGRKVEVFSLGGGAPTAGEDPDGHGTHVAAIAAGLPYRAPSMTEDVAGMAPGADLMVYGTNFGTPRITEAVLDLCERARDANRRLVVNLSLGGHFGAHDGTSDFEDELDEVSADYDVPIVVAAGNERQDRIHASGVFASGRDQPGVWTAAFDVPEGPIGRNRPLPAQLSLRIAGVPENGSALKIVLRPPTAIEGFVAFSVDHPKSHDFGYGVQVVPALEAHPHQDVRFLSMMIYGGPNAVGQWRVTVEEATAGQPEISIHAWLPVLGARGQPVAQFIPEDAVEEGSVSIPATAQSAIAVAAITNRSEWQSADGLTLLPGRTPGQAAPFSSPGPTADGRSTAPWIAAPGDAVISAMSAQTINPNLSDVIAPDAGSKLIAISGTSMAAPAIAGLIALMLEDDPELTVDQIRNRLRDATVADASPEWRPDIGYGVPQLVRLVPP